MLVEASDVCYTTRAPVLGDESFVLNVGSLLLCTSGPSVSYTIRMRTMVLVAGSWLLVASSTQAGACLCADTRRRLA